MRDIHGEITYKDKKLKYIFNINVMEKIQEKYGSLDKWGSLTDGKNGEPNAAALKFGFREMLNEAVDISNEENNANEPFFTLQQVGRILTAVGFDRATDKLNKTIIDSTANPEKNG